MKNKTHHNFKHGHSWSKIGDSTLYYIWYNMKRRCYYPTHKSYIYYGAKGISVCKKWMDFRCFLIDMEEKDPSQTYLHLEIGAKVYCKKNCRWITFEEYKVMRKLRREWFNASF